MRMNVIEAEDLVLAYGNQVAVDRSTFSVPAGAVTAVIGPNGSGKSTLLNALAGLLEPASGTLTVRTGRGGTPRIALVPQTTKVNDAVPVSVREVVTMGRYADKGMFGWLSDEDRAAVTEAMNRTDVDGLATKHLRELSGGQRQRVFVAQGLAQEHDILLLDEPLSGIDLPTAVAIDQVIHDEIEEGCSVIWTTHDLSEARVADHVLLLSGRVVGSGPPEDVLNAENLNAAYGANLLHLEGGAVFVDDAAHRPVPGRHVHRERTIHTESSPVREHGEQPKRER